MTDVKVVTPANMGKGIKWNASTKKYEVDIAPDQPIGINRMGQLELRISDIERNVLRLRDGKLFMSLDPNDYAQRFYVHGTRGSDNNDGSFERPFRTFNKAIEMTKNIVSYVDIFLYKDLTYDYPALNNRFKHNIRLTIHAYDENNRDGSVTGYPYRVPTNAYYRGHIARSYPRPTLRIRVLEDASNNGAFTRQVLYVKRLVAHGIIFDINDTAPRIDDSKSGSFDGIFGDQVEMSELYGCTIRYTPTQHVGSAAGAYRRDVLLRGDIKWINSLLENDPSKTRFPSALVSSMFTTKFTCIDWHSDHLQGYGTATDYPTLTGGNTPVWTNMSAGCFHGSPPHNANGVLLNFQPVA